MKYLVLLILIAITPLQSFSKSCKSEIKSQIKHVKSIIKDSKKANIEEMELIFNSDEYASSIEKAQYTKKVFDEKFLPQLEKSFSNIEMGVEKSLARLKIQGKDSKVCQDRNLIAQVGNGNIESIQGMLLMKSQFAIAFAQGDGEINDEFVEKAGAIFALLKSK